MINTLTGSVQDINDANITLLVEGIGFSVTVANPNLLQKENQITLYIYQHWNSETGPALYGFVEQLEKKVFLLIIDCPGIGPKIGLAILAQLGALSFLQVVQSGNDKALSAVNGIGAKKAEQIIVQLKHKVSKLIESGIDISNSESLSQRHQILEALKSLNYSRQEITAAMNYLNEQCPNTAAFDQLMRYALTFLAKRA